MLIPGFLTPKAISSRIKVLSGVCQSHCINAIRGVCVHFVLIFCPFDTLSQSKGLQKLKFYCQMCGKQCRDAVRCIHIHTPHTPQKQKQKQK
jgi:hypothetical protein